MRLWERRVRIGRETKIEVEIESNTNNHIGLNRRCRSGGRSGVRNLHAVLPISADGSSRGKLSGKLWRIHNDSVDSYASYSNRRVTLCNSLQLFIWNSRNISDKRSYHQDSNRGTCNRCRRYAYNP